MEKRVMKFKLPLLENLSAVEAMVRIGYQETGNKFDVVFAGSKGYLDHIAISCEGHQGEQNNRIDVARLRTKAGRLRSVDVRVYHSEKNGVRVEVGKEAFAEPTPPDHPVRLNYFRVDGAYHMYVPDPAGHPVAHDWISEPVEPGVITGKYGPNALLDVPEYPSIEAALEEFNKLPF